MWGKPIFEAIIFENSKSWECENPIVKRVTLIPRSLHIFASNVLSRPPEKAIATDGLVVVSSDSATAVNRAFCTSDSNNKNYSANSIYINKIYVMY
jgi:hypothetical protein